MYKIVAGFHTGFVFGRGKNQSCKAYCFLSIQENHQSLIQRYTVKQYAYTCFVMTL